MLRKLLGHVVDEAQRGDLIGTGLDWLSDSYEDRGRASSHVLCALLESTSGAEREVLLTLAGRWLVAHRDHPRATQVRALIEQPI